MNAFLTMLSNDEYTDGVVVLNHSIIKTKTRHNFYAVVGSDVSVSSRRILEDNNIGLIDIDTNIELPDNMIRENGEAKRLRWNRSFDKLSIFSLTQFRKVVFLDADMIVLRNLDHLFECPDMSAAPDERKLTKPGELVGLNSGLMVFSPREGLSEVLVRSIPKIYKGTGSFGDQDVINAHLPYWSTSPELHLDRGYNLFSIKVDRYFWLHGYGRKRSCPIYVLHYVGRTKPWAKRGWRAALKCFALIVKAKPLRALAFAWYLRLLRSAEHGLSHNSAAAMNGTGRQRRRAASEASGQRRTGRSSG